jgi:hypothetical protein
VSPSEIAFLAVGLILGAGVGAAVVEALRARPAPGGQVRVTVSPNSLGARGGHTLSEGTPSPNPGPVPGSPADGAWADDHDDPAGGPPSATPETAPAGVPGRTPVPSTPAGLPAGAVAVPVQGATSIPVGPGAMTMAHNEPGTDDREPRTQASATSRPTAVAVLDGTARPAVPPQPLPRPATVSVVDVGPTAPGVGVRPRPPVGRASPALGAAPVAVPVTRPSGRLPRRAADDELAGPMAITPASTDPCDVPRRLVDERCTVASEARVNAKAAADALREAQRAYDTLREHLDRAEQGADPREVAAAKDELHRRFRSASDGAANAEAAEAAAREWLDAINELNNRSREAARFLQTGGADLRAAGPRIERLAVDADAARIRAEGAEVACRDARERLADCEEAEARGPAPVPPTGGDEPHPFDEAWPGESESTRTQPLDESQPVLGGPGLPLVIRVLRGDREARDRLVAILAGHDPEAVRTWQLRVTALVDAIAARAIEDGYLDLPDDHPFWGLFTYAERREVIGALSALGYRFDGLGGFADDRVPAARDLALAVGYAGLDRMRIRTWPRESEARELYAQASVAADEWLAHQADDLSLGRMVDALGARAADLADVWNAWGRVRPALLAED